MDSERPEDYLKNPIVLGVARVCRHWVAMKARHAREERRLLGLVLAAQGRLVKRCSEAAARGRQAALRQLMGDQPVVLDLWERCKAAALARAHRGIKQALRKKDQ